MSRAKTGIQALDMMLGGGLLRDSITLISGNPGTGKSTLAVQFLLEGISSGENGAYISLEEEKHGFYRNMLGFGWDLKKLEDEGSIYFESYRAEELLKLISDGYQALDHEIRKIHAKRLVIDSISAYLLTCDGELSRRNETKRLFDNIRKWRLTALLTGESRQADMGYGIDYMVDAIIRTHNREDGGHSRRHRRIEIEKMRGSKHSQEARLMRITDAGMDVTNPEGMAYHDDIKSRIGVSVDCPFKQPGAGGRQ
ncbi:MAG: ATPase domain-containing protein [Candidatus Altiarchaeota archaeon]